MLIAQRAELHHEGKWEFPGGKVDGDESPEQALIRELKEELNLNCSDLEFYCETGVSFLDKRIVLLTYLVNDFAGDMIQAVHADLKWVALTELVKYTFLTADIPVVEKLQAAFKA